MEQFRNDQAMEKKVNFVVDASVVTKWFLIEKGSDYAIGVRDDFATGRISLTVPHYSSTKS